MYILFPFSKHFLAILLLIFGIYPFISFSIKDADKSL